MSSPNERRSAGTSHRGWLRYWLRDSTILLFSQAGGVVATSILAILLARRLGPADWGIFSGFLGLSLALNVFVDLGLGAWLLRELSAYWSRPRSDQFEPSTILGAAVLINGVLGGSLTVIAALSGALLHWELDHLFTLSALCLYSTGLAVAGVLESSLRARRAIGAVLLSNLAEKGVLLVLVLVLLRVSDSLWPIGVAYLGGVAVRVSLSKWMVRQRVQQSSGRLSRSVIRHVISGSLPFALNITALNVIPRLDVFLVATISASAAGYFALGNRVLGPALLIPAVASSTLYPFMASRAGGAAVWRVAGGLAVLGGMLSLFGILAAPKLVPAIFGEPFQSAVSTTQVMLLSLPLTFCAGPVMARLLSSGLERRVVGLTSIAALVGTVGILTGLMSAGPVGAGIGYLIRQGLFAAVLIGLMWTARAGLGREAAGVGATGQEEQGLAVSIQSVEA